MQDFNSGKADITEEYIPKHRSILDKFLDEKPHKQRSLTKSFPGYKAALFFKAVTEVSKNYDTQLIFGIYRGELCAPTYSYLEIGRGKREEILIGGYRLLKAKDGRKLVVYVSVGFRSMDLNLTYREKDNDLPILFLKDIETYMDENNFYKGEKITPAGKFLPVPNMTFNDVKLDDDKKKSIRVGALEFFNKKNIYDKNNIPFKRGLIFTGLPGTGKTLTGKILMAQSKCTFIWVTSDMVSYAGDIKYLYNMARELAPCILFMEDLDDYLESRSAVDVIKTQMDGLEDVNGICSILCTNYPDRLPKALLDRPSRFDDIIIFELPDEQLRYQILLQIGQHMDIAGRDKNLRLIASKSKGLTGAHLKEILVFAILLAADEDREIIELKDLDAALNKVLKTKRIVNEKINLISVKNLVAELKKSKEAK